MTFDAAPCGPARAGIRERLDALLRVRDAADLDAVCPTTPEWSGRDVLAHLVGVDADILAGRLDGVGTDAWTAVQVDARRDRTVTELLDEWAEAGPQVEAIAGAFGDAAGQWCFDAATHEHDLRLLLGEAGLRDSDAVTIGTAWLLARLGERLDTEGLPGLTFTFADGPVTVGSGGPATAVTVDRFEVFRAACGRRSVAQIDAWDWSGAPRTADLVRPPFSPAPSTVVE